MWQLGVHGHGLPWWVEILISATVNDLFIVSFKPRWHAFIGADKTAAVGEASDTGAEMTEEEWNLRVAELNKHQVGSA